MKCYLLKHRNIQTRIASRSGGAFSCFSDLFLENNGVVYGCSFDGIYSVKHFRATTKSERDTMRGSKYLQSDLSGIFGLVKKDLLDDRLVLFSGTGCQNAALKLYLNDTPQKNLLCIDILCHGVPSHKVYVDFLNYYQKKMGKKIVDVQFRNKYKFGWKANVSSLFFEDGSEIDSEEFNSVFLENYILRPSCYNCLYKKVDERKSDIIMGDAWGIENANQNFNDNNGVSIIISLTSKGTNAFDLIKDKCDYLPCSLDAYLQEALVSSPNKPKKVEAYWRYYHRHSFAIFLKHCSFVHLFTQAKKKIRRIFKNEKK